MTAAELLAKYAISVDDARDWIMAHLDSPHTIFNTAREFGISSDMLAELVAPVVPGATADMVESFFSSYGLDGSLLRVPDSVPTPPGREILPSDMAALTKLVTFNTYGGVLATEALRAAVITSPVTPEQYDAAFSPASYTGSEDGVMTGAELGISGFPSFAATSANLESLYYGTVINAFKAIDMSEIMEINNFVTAHAADLEHGSADTMTAYIQLMVSVFEDPAAVPILNDALLANAIVTGTRNFVTVVGSGDSSALFDGLLMGFTG